MLKKRKPSFAEIFCSRAESISERLSGLNESVGFASPNGIGHFIWREWLGSMEMSAIRLNADYKEHTGCFRLKKRLKSLI